jgi:hypothetical protein
MSFDILVEVDSASTPTKMSSLWEDSGCLACAEVRVLCALCYFNVLTGLDFVDT